jgi:hypothetical protein
VTEFGVSKPKHHHNYIDDEHQNKTLFSCGSLAPKLKRGGGCMDHGFTRPQELWELSDGCIHILRELCLTKDEQGMGYVVKMLEKV